MFQRSRHSSSPTTSKYKEEIDQYKQELATIKQKYRAQIQQSQALAEEVDHLRVSLKEAVINLESTQKDNQDLKAKLDEKPSVIESIKPGTPSRFLTFSVTDSPLGTPFTKNPYSPLDGQIFAQTKSFANNDDESFAKPAQTLRNVFQEHEEKQSQQQQQQKELLQSENNKENKESQKKKNQNSVLRCIEVIAKLTEHMLELEREFKKGAPLSPSGSYKFDKSIIDDLRITHLEKSMRLCLKATRLINENKEFSLVDASSNQVENTIFSSTQKQNCKKKFEFDKAAFDIRKSIDELNGLRENEKELQTIREDLLNMTNEVLDSQMKLNTRLDELVQREKDVSDSEKEIKSQKEKLERREQELSEREQMLADREKQFLSQQADAQQIFEKQLAQQKVNQHASNKNQVVEIKTNVRKSFKAIAEHFVWMVQQLEGVAENRLSRKIVQLDARLSTFAKVKTKIAELKEEVRVLKVMNQEYKLMIQVLQNPQHKAVVLDSKRQQPYKSPSPKRKSPVKTSPRLKLKNANEINERFENLMFHLTEELKLLKEDEEEGESNE